MSPTPDNPLPSQPAPAPGSSTVPFDETLRLIAQAPVPAGLKERVHAALIEAGPHKAPRGKVVAWPVANAPSPHWAGSGWMRAVAAAAIVVVVAGGGWGVYQRVEHPTAKVMVMPAPQPAMSGAFSSAGAIRTPQTVKGPALVHPVTKTAGKKQAGRKTSVRPTARLAAPPVSAGAGSQ